MKKEILVVHILLLPLLFCSLSAYAADLTFAPLPMEQKEKVLRQIAPMLHYLEKTTNDHFIIKYFDNYADILHDFQQNIIDLAFLGPLPYVQLRAQFPEAEPVVRFLNKQGQATYTCSLITGVESGVATAGALKGKRIGLTQPHSTCGYLCTGQLLQQAGFNIEDTRFHYTGSHQEVALAVVRGEYDAGGIKTSIGKMYTHLGLRFLSETKPLPGFLLVANKKTVSGEQIESIRKSLLELRPLEKSSQQELTRGWGKNVRYGATRALDSDYDVIRNTLQAITIPDHGNF